MPAVAASVVLIAAGWFGGWEWVAPCLIVLAQLSRRRFSVAEVLATAGAGLAWLVLFHFTGNRELYFPYTMQYAVQMAMLSFGGRCWKAGLGGALIVAVFTVARLLQAASAAVLAVELFVAAGVLAIAIAACEPGQGRAASRLAAAAIGSLIAFAGLAL